MANPTPLRSDPNGNVLATGSKLVTIMDVAITNAAWFAVTLGTDVNCKSVFIQTRDGSDWLLSADSAGTTYATMANGFGIDIVKYEGETICWVRATVAVATLEVIVLD
jgi:hypothetical protein